MNQETNPITVVSIKLVSGEFVIGELDKALGDSFNDVHHLYIRNPAILVNVDGSILMSRWNIFSRFNYIPIPMDKFIYVDAPNNDLTSKYLTFAYPELFPDVSKHLPSKIDTRH
jgi:hypothetical protein